MNKKISYKDSGVDIDNANEFTKNIFLTSTMGISYKIGSKI